MKPKSKLVRFFLKLIKSPVRVALLIGLLVVVLMPPLVPRHQIHLDNNFSAPNRMYAYYPDTSGNITDMSFLRTGNTSLALESYEDRLYVIEGLSYEDYNKIYCPLPAPKRDWIFLEDIDGDKYQEVFYVSQENDSAKLIVTSTKSLKTESVKYLPIKGELLYYYLNFYYFNDDSLVYFSIGSKLEKGQFETILFSYNYDTDVLKSIYKSPTLQNGEQYIGYDKCVVLTNKIKKKITFTTIDLETSRSVNYVPDPMKVTMIKNNINIETYPYQYASDGFLYHNKDSLFYGNIKDLIEDTTISGRLIDVDYAMSKEFPDWKSFHIVYYKSGVVFYVIGEKYDKKLYKYDFESDKLSRIRIKGRPQVGTILYYGDIDDNGKNDLVFTDYKSANDAYCIYEEGSFSNICRYPVDREKMKVANCAIENDSILFQCKGVEYVIIYKMNPEYYKHWLWCGGIFAIIMLIGFLLQKIKENRELRRKETNSRILLLQLENVQKRIDPHFIFNSLNNLGSLILEGESNASYDYLSKVSGVLYKALRNRSILVTVEEELNFCTSVLDTQRQRFKDKFDYEVFIDKGVDMHRYMPSNILNSMVDNCIKHGFSGIDSLGLITIEIIQKEEGLLLVVEDNGKGRDAAQADKDQTKSTGTGLEICHQYVTLLNNERKRNLLSFRIMDLYNEDKTPKGTRCEFFVPGDLKQYN